MPAVQQPVYGGAGGCHVNVGFHVYHGWVAKPNLLLVSDVDILASPAYAARLGFIAALKNTFNMVVAEANLEGFAAQVGYSPISAPATGDYSSNIICAGRRYLAPANTTDDGTTYLTEISLSFPGVHGRQNFSPVPGTKHLGIGWNAAQFTFSDQPKAFGFWVCDLIETVSHSDPLLHYPYLVITTNTTTFTWSPPSGAINDMIAGGSADFIGLVVASGQYLVKVVLRWGNYPIDPDFINYGGFDGLIVAKCP